MDCHYFEVKSLNLRVNNNIPLPLEAVVSAADLVGGNDDSKTGEQVQSTTSRLIYSVCYSFQLHLSIFHFRSDVRSARLAEMLGVTTIDSTTPSTSAETTTHQDTSNEVQYFNMQAFFTFKCLDSIYFWAGFGRFRRANAGSDCAQRDSRRREADSEG